MLTVLCFFNDFGSGRLLGLSWDLLVSSCGPLGGSWRLLGSFLGLVWATWASLRVSCGLFVILLGPLGGSWRLLGRLLGLAWAVPLVRLASGSKFHFWDPLPRGGWFGFGGLGSNMDELPSPEVRFWKSMFFFVIALWV